MIAPKNGRVDRYHILSEPQYLCVLILMIFVHVCRFVSFFSHTSAMITLWGLPALLFSFLFSGNSATFLNTLSVITNQTGKGFYKAGTAGRCSAEFSRRDEITANSICASTDPVLQGGQRSAADWKSKLRCGFLCFYPHYLITVGLSSARRLFEYNAWFYIKVWHYGNKLICSCFEHIFQK